MLEAPQSDAELVRELRTLSSDIGKGLPPIRAKMPLPPKVLFTRRLWGRRVRHLSESDQQVLAHRIFTRLSIYMMVVVIPQIL